MVYVERKPLTAAATHVSRNLFHKCSDDRPHDVVRTERETYGR